MPQDILQGFRLSPQQKHLWLAQHDGPAYHALSAILIEGKLDPALLKEAVRRVVRRHEVLRTTFQCLPGMKVPVQVIAESHDLPWRQVELSEPDARGEEAGIEELLRSEQLTPFDFARGPLARFTLLALAADRHALLVALPALCADARSLKNLALEISRAYASCLRGEDAGEEPVQYAQFSEWQNELLEAEDGEVGREHWRRQNLGAARALTLPFESGGRGGAGCASETLARTVEPEVAAKIEALAAGHDAPVAAVLLACWQTLLWRLTRQSDIAVSLLCDGRVYEPMHEALGLYARWPLVLSHFDDDLRFAELAEHVKKAVEDAHEWQEYFSCEGNGGPSGCGPEGSSPAVGFAFEEWPRERPAGDVRFSVHKLYSRTNSSKLELACVRTAGALTLEYRYDPAFFSPEDITRLAGWFTTLLGSVAENPRAHVGELNLMGERERHRLLVEWNNTGSDYDEDACLHQLFEAQAARTPDALAVAYEDAALSYRELNRRASQLARRLRRLGVGPESRVVLFMERSPEMVIGLLGIWKAGGAYVPVDTRQPRARLASIFAELGAPVVLTQKHLAEGLPGRRGEVVCLDSGWELIARESEAELDTGVSPRHPAYVIYTSGSTGEPKGVMIEHRSAANLSAGLERAVYGPLRAHLRVGMNAPLFFDSSVKQLLQLLRGHALRILPEGVRRDGDELLAYLRREALDVLDCTPSQLKLLSATAGWLDAMPAQTLVGGEAIDGPTWALLAGQPRATFHNLYGPTECTVDATVCRLREGSAQPSIGRPITNTRVYVLDAGLRPVPAGVAGELYIGGASLARGYLKRPELTAERFVPDPFTGEAGARLYRTGDLARYRPDGEIEFLGRVDHQVKVRGFRVELGEVEAALRGQEGVREAVAAVCEDGAGEKNLVAYVVANRGRTLSLGEMRNSLQEKLPEYMLPSTLVVLDALPLTRNGKVDRRALPAPEHARSESGKTYAAPRTPVEEVLAEIWAQVLRLERVGIDDNFFDLGGHSILATQLISRVRKAFRAEIPLRLLFEQPTIYGLAEGVEEVLKGGGGLLAPPVEPVARDMELPLSFGQQRLWFIQQLDPDSSAYNIPSAVRLTGALNVAALEQTINAAVERHEVLRTIFPAAGGNPVQVIAPARRLTLPLVDLSGSGETEREAGARRLATEEARRPFDLTQGPLLRATLLRLGEGRHALLLTVHHIVFDEWSIGLLIREIKTLYGLAAAGAPLLLPRLPVQYADFAVWQRRWLEQGETLDAELGYWERQLANLTPLELPSDRPRPPVQTFRGGKQSVALGESLSRRLKALGREEGATLFMTLLAAFKALLYRYTGQYDLVVGTPVANRGRIETEGLIGFFLNTLVMRTDLSGDPSFREILGRVREVALGAYAHQDLPFEKLVEELQPKRDLSRTPLFQILFALRSAPPDASELPGLALTPLEVERQTSMFDLALFINETEQGLSAVAEYNSDLFDAATVGRMLEHLRTLAQGAVALPDEPLSRLPVLTEAEESQLLVRWNETDREYPQEQCLQRLFEVQAERTPEAVAVVFEGQHLTYRELNARANQLARRLRSLGVGPDVFVGLCLERSLEMVVAVLGVLKAGGAYVPLNPTYPKDRLSFMLEDTGVAVLLTQQSLLDVLPPRELRVVCLDDYRGLLAPEREDNLSPRAGADNLAYVTYTSGSTGRPKGIAMTQRPLLNLMGWHRRTEPPDGARTLQFASLSFDVSFQDMFSTWYSGGTLVMIPEAVRQDLNGLPSVLADEAVNRLYIPAVALQQLAEGFCARESFAAPLRKIIAGSEQLQVTPAVARLFREIAGCALHNEYGPSETHVVTALALDGPPSCWPERPSVGRPIFNTRIYLLDRDFQPVPVGVPGELYIGGVCLARGYLNSPHITAERFVPDLFGEPGARLYRTGDLSRYLPDGNIEFLGRLDHQVKIRGFRIELGEIESVLGQHPSAEEVVVVAREDAPGNKRLVAYVVTRRGGAPTVSELRSFLQQELPDYMIPSAFVFLDALPLNANGKVDRRALPVPDQSRPELEPAFVPPRTALEEVLAGFWAEVLGVERVGVDDDFFDLGGHSLLATQVVSRVREFLQAELPLRALFAAPTVASLAERMTREEARPGGLEKIARVVRELTLISEDEARELLRQEQVPTQAAP